MEIRSWRGNERVPVQCCLTVSAKVVPSDGLKLSLAHLHDRRLSASLANKGTALVKRNVDIEPFTSCWDGDSARNDVAFDASSPTDPHFNVAPLSKNLRDERLRIDRNSWRPAGPRSHFHRARIRRIPSGIHDGLNADDPSEFEVKAKRLYWAAIRS